MFEIKTGWIGHGTENDDHVRHQDKEDEYNSITDSPFFPGASKRSFHESIDKCRNNREQEWVDEVEKHDRVIRRTHPTNIEDIVRRHDDSNGIGDICHGKKPDPTKYP